MRWQKPNLKSIYGLLGQTPPPMKASTDVRLQIVRLAMLEAMTDAGLDTLHLHLVGRIRYADDAMALWNIRSDMMTLLAAELGEAQAWQVMDALSAMFRGLLPVGLTSGKTRRQSR